jgi:Taurine catabolism dioxygenase TauD, TfdA family
MGLRHDRSERSRRLERPTRLEADSKSPCDNEIDELTPTTEDGSRPKSLSATYGLGAQPLHTDGAHLRQPPDLVALHAPTPNSTPTLLWKPPYPPAALSNGLFLVDAGTDKFLAAPYSLRSGFRFDPGCMRPLDQRARLADDYFKEHHRKVIEHHWTSPGQLLLIDNRRVLHARAAVSAEDETRRIDRASFEVDQ